MAPHRIRPQFVCSIADEPAAFLSALVAHLGRDGTNVRGQTFDGGALLRLRNSEREVWSPALYVHIDGDSPGPWQVHGRFSPSSSVWTAFVAIHLLLACVGLAAGCYGGAQIILGEPPWAFWGVPLVIVLAGFTYGAAFIGQGLGAEDMYELRSFIDEVVESLETSH